jgi:hypothetical protein
MSISDADLAQFRSLVGSPAWNAARHDRIFFTLEFGPPRLFFQEKYYDPALRRPGFAPPPRRRVVVRGEWSLSLEYADWEIGWENMRARSDEVVRRAAGADFGDIDDILRCLGGQKLAHVGALQGEFDFELSFDLGGFLKIGSRTARYARCWSLYRRDECVAAVEM